MTQRNIVICCDGTWNEPDQVDRDRIAVSNVVHLARAARDGGETRVEYLKGVGTGGFFDRMLGGMTGAGLASRILEAYERTQAHVQQVVGDGDEPRLFLIGFSRGAYTVRSLAGLLTKVGVSLPADVAFDVYKGAELPAGEKVESLEVYFLGVWDTVGALGIPLPISERFWDVSKLRSTFRDRKLSRKVRHAYQALAIDERRGPFQPCAWDTSGLSGGQVVEQVWFAGVHSNLGGGYVDDGLSGHSFRWLLQAAIDKGLVARLDYVDPPHTPTPNHRGELRDSCVGLYKWLWKHPRLVGQSDPGHSEFVHPSAVARLLDETVPDYTPSNLLDAVDKAWLQQAAEHVREHGMNGEPLPLTPPEATSG